MRYLPDFTENTVSSNGQLFPFSAVESKREYYFVANGIVYLGQVLLVDDEYSFRAFENRLEITQTELGQAFVAWMRQFYHGV